MYIYVYIYICIYIYAASEVLQSDEDLAAAFSTYAEARRKLSEKLRSRGFRPLGHARGRRVSLWDTWLLANWAYKQATGSCLDVFVRRSDVVHGWSCIRDGFKHTRGVHDPSRSANISHSGHFVWRADLSTASFLWSRLVHEQIHWGPKTWEFWGIKFGGHTAVDMTVILGWRRSRAGLNRSCASKARSVIVQPISPSAFLRSSLVSGSRGEMSVPTSCPTEAAQPSSTQQQFQPTRVRPQGPCFPHMSLGECWAREPTRL